MDMQSENLSLGLGACIICDFGPGFLMAETVIICPQWGRPGFDPWVRRMS